jgi:hypothetical protein
MASSLAEIKLAALAELKRLQGEYEEYESDRLKNVDAFAVLGYQPTCIPLKAGTITEPCGECPQEKFHAATEDDVLFGGAAGGGKTTALVMESIRACTRYPGVRVLILRRSYDELAESVYPEFQRVDWAAALGARWNRTEKELRFPNRSVIRLRYMDSLEDASRRQGGAYQLLCVDERTLLPPGVVDVISLERLRSAHGVPVIGIRSTCNPGGPGHGEVKERYIKPTMHGAKVLTDEHGLTKRFIPAKATDNPYLDSAYFRRLDSIPDPSRRAAMRDGDWDQFSGMIFTKFRWDRHTVTPMPMPKTWHRYTGTDWGYAAPYANVWAAVDEDGRVWVYREIYESHVGEADQARKVQLAETAGEFILVRYADDAMWATRGDAKPIADVWAEEGVYLTPAGKGPGSRLAGLQRIHSYLNEGPACPHHRAQGWETCPMIHFFRTCSKMLYELTNLPYATTGNTEESDPAAADHAVDALRYLLINLGGGPQFPILDELQGASPFDDLDLLTPMGAWAVREDSAYSELLEGNGGGDDGDQAVKPGQVQASPFTSPGNSRTPRGVGPPGGGA